MIMKTQKFNIMLNYELLAQNINNERPYNFDCEKFDDSEIISRFSRYLLGDILSNIENSLELVYVGKDNTIHNISIDITESPLTHGKNIVFLNEEDDLSDEETKELQQLLPEITKEILDKCEYYKNHFIKLYEMAGIY